MGVSRYSVFEFWDAAGGMSRGAPQIQHEVTLDLTAEGDIIARCRVQGAISLPMAIASKFNAVVFMVVANCFCFVQGSQYTMVKANSP